MSRAIPTLEPTTSESTSAVSGRDRDVASHPAAPALRSLMLTTALLLAIALSGALPATAAVHDDGDKVRLTGLVTDQAGNPIPQLHVVLEVARSYFDVRSFQRAKKDIRRLTGLTNQRGEYDLEWIWNDYYNNFELLVGIPVRRPDGERLKVLERLDVTRRVERGTPVVSAVVVENADFVRNLRQFLATIRSEDERRVHQEMGRPDKVERTEYPQHVETAWWYFVAGKVYRFRDGQLAGIDSFDPVEGL